MDKNDFNKYITEEKILMKIKDTITLILMIHFC